MFLTINKYLDLNEEMLLSEVSFSYIEFKDYSEVNNELINNMFAFSLLLNQDEKNQIVLFVDLVDSQQNKLSITRFEDRITGYILKPDLDFDFPSCSIEIITQNYLTNQQVTSYIPVKGNLLDTLNDYFASSVQNRIHGSLIFDKTSNTVGAFLFELLPHSQKQIDDLITLENQIKADRLLLKKQFKNISEKEYLFGCKCSKESITKQVKNLYLSNKEDIFDIHNKVEVSCGICNKHYVISKEDLE